MSDRTLLHGIIFRITSGTNNSKRVKIQFPIDSDSHSYSFTISNRSYLYILRFLFIYTPPFLYQED